MVRRSLLAERDSLLANLPRDSATLPTKHPFEEGGGRRGGGGGGGEEEVRGLLGDLAEGEARNQVLV